METKNGKCKRIAKEMKQDFLNAGIPEEQHIAAVALILDGLDYYKQEFQRIYDSIKIQLAKR